MTSPLGMRRGLHGSPAGTPSGLVKRGSADSLDSPVAPGGLPLKPGRPVAFSSRQKDLLSAEMTGLASAVASGNEEAIDARMKRLMQLFGAVPPSPHRLPPLTAANFRHGSASEADLALSCGPARGLTPDAVPPHRPGFIPVRTISAVADTAFDATSMNGMPVMTPRPPAGLPPSPVGRRSVSSVTNLMTHEGVDPSTVARKVFCAFEHSERTNELYPEENTAWERLLQEEKTARLQAKLREEETDKRYLKEHGHPDPERVVRSKVGAALAHEKSVLDSSVYPGGRLMKFEWLYTSRIDKEARIQCLIRQQTLANEEAIRINLTDMEAEERRQMEQFDRREPAVRAALAAGEPIGEGSMPMNVGDLEAEEEQGQKEPQPAAAASETAATAAEVDRPASE